MTASWRSCAALLVAGAGLTAAYASSGSRSTILPVNGPVARVHEVGSTVRQLPPPSERWALVVGIGEYGAASNLSPLHGDIDATAFARTLEERAGFRNDHIVLLAGQRTKDCRPLRIGAAEEAASTATPCKPTRKKILDGLAQITAEMKAAGLLVFFFSGHGQHVADESVLFPADLTYDLTVSGERRELDLRHRGISGRDVANIISGARVKQALIFLDACRVQLTREQGTQDRKASSEFGQGFDLKTLGVDVEAAMTFYSSGQDSASYEDENGRSYFTSELVNAFDGRRDAYGPRNLLTLGSLIQYVTSNVKNRVQQDKGALQQPDYRPDGYAEEVVLAGREVPGGSHPTLLSGSVVLMTPDGTRVYVANRRGVLNVFDTVTGQPQQIIDLRPGTPERMVMAARRGMIYVIDPASRTVVVIDAAKQQVVERLPTGISPEDLALTPDESKLYVSNQQPAPKGSISVFDLRGGGRALAAIRDVNCPEGLAMAPDGALMYVESQCGFADDPLFVVDTKTDRVDHSLRGFAVGTTALGMLPNGEKLYIATGEPERTRVLITATGDVKPLGRIGDPAAYARYFAATPDGKYVLGVGGSRYLLVIDAITDEVVRVKDLGSPGAGIAVGMAPGTTRAVCYVWLPEENRLFFTGLDGILAGGSEH